MPIAVHSPATSSEKIRGRGETLTSSPCARFAIIGCGPKGTYALERLVAEIRKRKLPSKVIIDVFEPTGHFGAGQVYAPGQPDFLLMNYSASNIDMWRKEGRNESGVSEVPTLTQWAGRNGYPEATGNEFLPRHFVGQYLANGFTAILKTCPSAIRINCHVDRVTGIKKLPCGRLALELPGGVSSQIRYDRVMMTTGHQLRSRTETFLASAREVTSVFPLERLNEITSDDSVAIRGMGLTFIDCVLALTEGRGGTFSRSRNGNLSYNPSGREPKKLVPFSRSGQLMVPRGPDRTSRAVDDPLSDLQEALGRPVDFRHDVWPTLLKTYSELDASSPLSANSTENHHRAVIRTLKQDLNDIATDSPRTARSAVWPSALATFRSLFEFGGLTPGSHREFDASHASELARLSFGPPPINGLKILALAESGLLDFRFARNPSPSEKKSRVRLIAENGEAMDADILVNATIPGNRGPESSELQPLYQSLIDAGLGRFFQNGDYIPGCLEIDKHGQLISVSGEAQPIHLYGTPTEGILFDNDSLSRKSNDLTAEWASHCVKTALTNIKL